MGLIRELLTVIGLTPARATALAYIQANLGQGQAELGRALEINRASAMELINSLVALNAVERREGRDRRSHSLFLTERGQELFAQFQKTSIEVDGIITSQMSSDELDMLSRLLTAMQNGVDSYLHSKGRKK
jgi:DNA-binding MarR family transcriptional regulator